MLLLELAGFVLLGAIAGAYGTLVGAGGGFLIVPVLLLVYHTTPQQAVGTSLAVILFNALSGTLAYVKQKRIDYATGWRFALATIPGAVIGSYLSSYLTSRFFNLIFGLFLVGVSVFLNLRPDASTARSKTIDGETVPSGFVRRLIVDENGVEHAYAFNMRQGLLFSFGVGFLSSILGIGGGIVHVPVMVFLFGIPAHIATATSHFVLLFTALAGTTSHVMLGDVLYLPAVAMAIGAVIGAQIGAFISRRMKSRTIVRVLSIALALAGIRLFVSAVTGA